MEDLGISLVIGDSDMLFTGQISERISELPAGGIVCHDVPIAKTGVMRYGPFELKKADGSFAITPGDGATVVVTDADCLRDPVTIASFENMPITIGHHGLITPKNHRALSRGNVRNVRFEQREDAGYLVGDLVIQDEEAIGAIRRKALREVSSGYRGKYTELRPGYGRRDWMIGNHVALCDAARGGPSLVIQDNATQETTTMTIADRVKSWMGKGLTADVAAQVAAAEDRAAQPAAGDVTALVAAMDKRMEGLEGSIATLAKALTPAQPDAATVAAAAAAAQTTVADTAIVALGKKVDVIADFLAAQVKSGHFGGTPAQGAQPAQGLAMCQDQDTISRAEILAPGIVKTQDVKAKALMACGMTQDGAAVINQLTAGQGVNDANRDMVFIAASEMLKGKRTSQLRQTQANGAVAFDAARDLDPVKMNQEADAFWSKHGGKTVTVQ